MLECPRHHRRALFDQITIATADTCNRQKAPKHVRPAQRHDAAGKSLDLAKDENDAHLSMVPFVIGRSSSAGLAYFSYA